MDIKIITLIDYVNYNCCGGGSIFKSKKTVKHEIVIHFLYIGYAFSLVDFLW